jgi:RNA polymerase sigma factor (sigma-70 family)
MNHYLNLGDDNLFSLLKTGDEDAFVAIYQKHWGTMYFYARKITQSIDGAEEVVQDTLSQLWKNRTELEIHSSATVFIYQLLRRTALIYVQQNGSDKYINSLSDFMDHGKYNVNSKVRDKELIKDIERAISLLPQNIRDLIELSKKGQLDRKSILALVKKSGDQEDKNVR